MIQVRAVVLAAFTFVLPLAAQGSAVVPPAYAAIRGNAALSMPLRWHQGLMQLHLESAVVGGVLPQEMLGKSLKQCVVRRPAFLEEPAYGALKRTFTVQLASTDLKSNSMVRDMGANRTAATSAKGASNLTTVVDKKSFSIPATTQPGYRDAVGQDLLVLPFATTFAFKGPDLFVDWESTSLDTRPDNNNWVDALVFSVGGDSGLVVSLGQGGCSSLTPTKGLPMTLEGEGEVPRSGATIALRLSNALPSAPSGLFVGLDARSLQKGSAAYTLLHPNLVYLTSFSRPGCMIWAAPLPDYLPGNTDAAGKLSFALPIPNLDHKVHGSQFVFQAGVFDVKTNRLEMSNGVAVLPGTANVRSHAATVLCPWPHELDGKGQKIPPTSPWPPFLSSTPILRFAF